MESRKLTESAFKIVYVTLNTFSFRQCFYIAFNLYNGIYT